MSERAEREQRHAEMHREGKVHLHFDEAKGALELSGVPAGEPHPLTWPQCHAGTDGDCVWIECPQARDGEPVKSGRHCPLDFDSGDR